MLNDIERIQNNKSISALTDLIVTVLLSSYEKQSLNTKNELVFSLDKRKEPYLVDFISLHGLRHYVFKREGVWYFHDSIRVHRIIKDWTRNGELIAIDPRLLRKDTFFLWILLFGRKTKTSVALDTCMPDFLKHEVPVLFNRFFGARLFAKSNAFYIKPYYHILDTAINSNRTAKENLEFNYLLPENEVSLFKRHLEQKEGDIYFEHH